MLTDYQTNTVYFSKRITWYKMWPVLRDALDEHGVTYVEIPVKKSSSALAGPEKVPTFVRASRVLLESRQPSKPEATVAK